MRICPWPIRIPTRFHVHECSTARQRTTYPVTIIMIHSVFYGFSYNRNFSDQNRLWTLFFCLARRRRKILVYFVSNYKIEVFFRLFFEEIRENMHRVSKFPGNITGNFLSRSRIPGNFRLYNRKKNTAMDFRAE